MDGVFEKAVTAIKLALSKGFRVTVNCTLFNRSHRKRSPTSSTTRWNWA
jgi:MoaA/NifB/PqqE/SkfB family radical SAM enzyme